MYQQHPAVAIFLYAQTQFNINWISRYYRYMQNSYHCH